MRIFGLVMLIAWSAWVAQGGDADIQALVDQVSQERYTVEQNAVEGMGLGTYGGPLFNQSTRGRAWVGVQGDKGNQEARKYIVERFAEIGVPAAIQGKYYNIVAEQLGASRPKDILIVAAHYDTKKSNTPGGDGDASGVAGVLEAARVLGQFRFACTIRYIVFNGTEKKFKGSDDYGRNVFGAGGEKLVGLIDLNGILHPRHDKNPELPQAVALGVGTKEASATAWAEAFLSAARQFVPTLPLDATGPVIDTTSDHYSLVLYGAQAALRLSTNAGKDRANLELHTPGDASDGPAGAHYDYAFATDVVRATVATIAVRAEMEGVADIRAAVDGDGDGYSDVIETELASDPASADSRPNDLPPAVAAGFQETSRVNVALNFAVDSADVVVVVGTVPVPAGFVTNQVSVIVDVSGVVKAFKLDGEGNDRKGNASASLRLKKVKGSVSAQLATVTVSLVEGNFKRRFTALGLVNGNLSLRPVTVPVTLIVGDQVRQTARVLLYSASKDLNSLAR